MDKNLDKKNRWRNVIVSFRVSPEERDDLNIRVKLSGLTKQGYIITRLSERDVIVQGNTRISKALRNQMTDIIAELKIIERCSDLSDDFIVMLKTVAQTYNGLEETKIRPSLNHLLEQMKDSRIHLTPIIL